MKAPLAGTYFAPPLGNDAHLSGLLALLLTITIENSLWEAFGFVSSAVSGTIVFLMTTVGLFSYFMDGRIKADLVSRVPIFLSICLVGLVISQIVILVIPSSDCTRVLLASICAILLTCGGLIISLVIKLLPSRQAKLIWLLGIAVLATGISMMVEMLEIGKGVSLVAIIGAVLLSVWLHPRRVYKHLARPAFRILFRANVSIPDDFANAQGGKLLLINHTSFLDGLVLAAFLPGRPSCILNKHTARRWYMAPMTRVCDCYCVEPTDTLGLRQIISLLRSGKSVGIFPEGRLTTTGATMRIFPGAAFIARRSGADVWLVNIDGLQHTRFAIAPPARGKRWFAPFRLDVRPSRVIADSHKESHDTERHLHNEMCEFMCAVRSERADLFGAVAAAAARVGGRAIALENERRDRWTYSSFLAAAEYAARQIATEVPSELGQMPRALVLANSTGALAVSLLALCRAGIEPVLTTDGESPAAVLAAFRECRCVAAIEVIEEGRTTAMLATHEALSKAGVKTVAITMNGAVLDTKRLLRASRTHSSGRWGVTFITQSNDGHCRTVKWSERALLENGLQVATTTAISPADVVLSRLAPRSSAGVVLGVLAPLLAGARLVSVDPRHPRELIGRAAYYANASAIFCERGSFEQLVEWAHRYDFYAVRSVWTEGWESWPESVTAFERKFGLQVLRYAQIGSAGPITAMQTRMYAEPQAPLARLPGYSLKQNHSLIEAVLR